MKKQDTSFLKDLLLLTALIGVLFGFMLGSRHLSAPDEGRYTEIPREMVATGDFITPRLNGVKYFEKPPLMYWAHSLSIKAFGVNEWALRFWPAILGLFGCLAVYGAGRRFYGRTVGLLSSMILATSVLYYAHTRILILDIGVAVFITFALLGYIIATLEPPGFKRSLYLAIFFSCSALAVMCKGLMGAAIPGTIILLWAIPLKKWDALKMAFAPWGILLFFAITAPWHILVSLENPEFPYFYFIYEHILRYTTTAHGRHQPLWFFVPIIFLGFFPWVSFFVQALGFNFKKIRENLKNESTTLFLFIWAGFVFVFFSISNSKLIPYIVPFFPPMAILIGRYLSVSENAAGIKKGFLVFKIICGILIVATPIALYTQNMLEFMALHPYIYGAVGVVFFGVLLTFWVTRTKSLAASLVTMAGISAALLMTLNSAWHLFDNRSVKVFAMEINKHLKPEDKVVAYGRYYQDLPPYVNRTIHVVNWKGELSFGMEQEDTSGWMINNDAFLKLWNGPKMVYMVTRKEFLKDLKSKNVENLNTLLETERDVLVVNRKG